MFRRALALLFAVLLITGLNTAPANAATLGVTFNNPVSPTQSTRNAIGSKIMWAINNSQAGTTIRIAAYSFDRKDVADALIAAKRRGVNVQMVLNDNWTSAQTARLKNFLGGGPSNPSFVKICKGACRGGDSGNLHLKVYAFSKAGSAEKLLYTGSANLTDRAVQLQWNDMVTLRDAPLLYEQFVRTFNELKYDRPASPRWIYFDQEPGIEAQYYRDRVGSGEAEEPKVYTRTPTAEEDPVMNRLKSVSCTAAPGTGMNGKTSIRISMYAWYEERGNWIADQVARLKRQGCDIRVTLSVPGGGVLKILREAGIEPRIADYKYYWVDGKRIADFYSHLKVMAISGTYKGKATRAVWTGSENWSTLSFNNDELTVGLFDAAIQQAYFDRYAYMSANYTHAVGKYPTTKPPYRG